MMSIQFGMHHRFATGNGDDRCSKIASLSRRAIDEFEIDRLRSVVILVAVATRQIAASHGNQMGEHRMPAGDQGAADKTKLPHL